MADTILDLEEKIRRSMGQKISKKDRAQLQKLKELKQKQLAANKKSSKLKRTIKEHGKKKGWTEERIKREQNKIFTYSIRDLNNSANRILKKDHLYIVDDRFSKPYKIKASDILSKDITASILKKMADGIQKAIDKTPKKDKEKIKTLKGLKEKVLYNLEVYKTSVKEFDEDELKKQKIPYPLFVEIIGETINII